MSDDGAAEGAGPASDLPGDEGGVAPDDGADGVAPDDGADGVAPAPEFADTADGRVPTGELRSRLGLPDDFSRAQRIFAVGGLVAALVAAVGLLVPALVPGPIEAVVTALPATVTLFLLVLFGVVLGVASSRRQPSSVEPTEREALREPRTPEARSPAVGWDIDDLLAEASDLDLPRELRRAAREDLRARLRDLAIRTLARETDAGPEAVETALYHGTWTRDRRASAMLGDETAPRPPWYVRLWDLLRSESVVRRRTRHALAAIEATAERGRLDTPAAADRTTRGRGGRPSGEQPGTAHAPTGTAGGQAATTATEGER